MNNHRDIAQVGALDKNCEDFDLTGTSRQCFTKYGIDCRLIVSEQDVETLRLFRNLPHVRKEMFYKEEISLDSHREWFKTLDRTKNFYFIYGLVSVDIGVVNLKGVDVTSGVGEAGIFVANESFFGSHVNIGALLFLYEFAFTTLGLHRLQAHILPANEKAIRMNVSLGFKLVDAHEHLYHLSKDDYLQTSRRFERLFPGTE